MQSVETLPTVTVLPDGSPRLLDRRDWTRAYRDQGEPNALRHARHEEGATPTVEGVGNRYRLSVADVTEIRVRYRETSEPVSRIAADFRITPAMVEEIGRAIAFDDRERGIVGEAFNRD